MPHPCGWFNDPISRRSFLEAAAGAGAILAPGCRGGDRTESQERTADVISSGLGYDYWQGIFDKITIGFIRNALVSSDTFAVCDYPGGTFTENFLAASGFTCDSVTRMLPALAARIISPEGGAVVKVDGVDYDLSEVMLKALANGTDPAGEDFWRYPGMRQNQRQVESSIVAWSLWLARDKIMDRFTPYQRSNIQEWLASCTVVPTRGNNWALFSAVNHAARIALSEKWSEFSGDEAYLRQDLEAIDGMYRANGWYSDTAEGNAYDYYNFWVFASHCLYLDAMVGQRFPDLREKYRERLRQFLDTTPYFFGGNGSHILFGRSLIYRWAVLTPLVLSYGLGLCPLPTGMLRRICNLSLVWLWDAEAFDVENGKLRETLTPYSNHDICESYINDGHPYWGMQAFFALSLGRDDPFWTADEEPLPVEKGDFYKVLDGPGLLLAGTSKSGQVRIWQSRCSQQYSNKYYNFSYSSHFPWNVGLAGDRIAHDCMLSFRAVNGDYGRRDSTYEGELWGDHVVAWRWSTKVGPQEIKVASMVLVDGEFEWRAHNITFGGEEILTAAEHTYALGLDRLENAETKSGGVWEWARNMEGKVVFIRAAFGFNSAGGFGGFEGREDLNSFYPRAGQAEVSARLKPGRHTLIAALYASPAPLPLDVLLKRSADIPQEIADFAGMEA